MGRRFHLFHSVTKDLSRLIRDTEFLPPAFQIVPKLLLLLDDPEANSEELADLIRLDPALTTEVLRVCNSAFYSGGYRAETLNEAVMRIGLREVYEVVMKVIASPILTEPQKGHGTENANLWNHSLATAAAAELVARDRGENSEVAFTAGLLHDIGKLVVTKALDGDYQRLLTEAQEKQQPLFTLERALFNMDHADAGGILLNRWNLPANIVAAVRFHHKPAAAGDFIRLASIVHLANHLAFLIGQGSGYSSYVRFLDKKALDALRFDPEDLAAFTEDIKRNFEKSIAVFN